MRKSITALATAAASIGLLAAAPAQAGGPEQSFDEIEFTRTFWMLMPVENKDLARMRVCWDFLRDVAANTHDVMMGRA